MRMSSVATCMKLEAILLSEIIKTQGDKQSKVSNHSWNHKKLILWKWRPTLLPQAEDSVGKMSGGEKVDYCELSYSQITIISLNVLHNRKAINNVKMYHIFLK